MLTKHLAVAGLLSVIHWGAALANKTWTPNGNIIGKLCGQQDTEGRQYLGIPYAQPPVGNLRFAAPQPYDKKYPPSGWNGTYQRSSCPQQQMFPGFGIGSVDEDCLFLNVYVPFRRTKDLIPFPVRVFIYGGGFYIGSTSQEIYDGCPSLETGDTIVVTINYRVGAFGFLALPGLFDTEHGVGNYGLQDQQLALKWVNKNIKYFGGDPNKVTIFGESAGGTSVFAQMVAKGSNGLFSGAISQSGATVEIPPLETGYRTGEDFVRKLNCTGRSGSIKGKHPKEQAVQCLRDASVQRLLEVDTPFDMLTYAKLDTIKFGPIVDGVFFREQIIDAVAGNRMNKGPNNEPITFMAGTNKDESSTFIMQLANYTTELPPAIYTKVLNTVVPPPYRKAALKQYNPAKYNGSEFHAATNLMTDFMFRCPNRRILAAHAASCKKSKSKQNCNTYGYLYTHMGRCLFMGPTSKEIGAPHAAELPYVFNTPKAGICNWNADDRKLSKIMISSWNRFARTGDPSVPGTDLSHWRAWTPKKPRYGILDVPTSVAKFSWKEECEIFDEIAGWKGA